MVPADVRGRDDSRLPGQHGEGSRRGLERKTGTLLFEHRKQLPADRKAEVVSPLDVFGSVREGTTKGDQRCAIGGHRGFRSQVSESLFWHQASDFRDDVVNGPALQPET